MAMTYFDLFSITFYFNLQTNKTSVLPIFPRQVISGNIPKGHFDLVSQKTQFSTHWPQNQILLKWENNCEVHVKRVTFPFTKLALKSEKVNSFPKWHYWNQGKIDHDKKSWKENVTSAEQALYTYMHIPWKIWELVL